MSAHRMAVMFTGIVESVGQVVAVVLRGADCEVEIDAPGLDWSGVKIGDIVEVLPLV